MAGEQQIPANSYDMHARSYHEHLADPVLSPLHAYYEKPAMQALVPALGGLSVVSLGCGSGEDAQWLKDNGAAEVTGVDLSQSLIAIARQQYAEIDFRVMDMSDLQLPSETFDIAYSSLAMHYVKSWQKPLAETYRILKAGGRFVFSCLHPLETALDYSSDDQQRRALFGRVIDSTSEERTIVGDYLSAETNGVRAVNRTVADEQAVTYYHRPFSVMIRDILATGFKIATVVEPQPDPAMQTTNPEHYKQVARQPKFILWDLRK